MPREHFSTLGVVVASAGSAIGLGNIWKFPYITGIYGGGAFLLVYLGCVILLGMPIMMSEFIIGRHTQSNVVDAFRQVAPNKKWRFVGIFNIIACFTILSFYSVVGGWTLAYSMKAASNSFVGKTASEIESIFHVFVENSIHPLFWHIIFTLIVAVIVSAGIKKGIERVSKVLMPMMVAFILILCIRVLFLPRMEQGFAFLFYPDFSKLSVEGFLVALGHAFFSLSIGSGVMLTYGSYISKRTKLGSTVISIATADTVIALLAGIMIFPAIFSFGVAPASGPGLVFATIPTILGLLPWSHFFTTIFFLLLTFAALTSAVSLMETAIAFIIELKSISRKKAIIVPTGILIVTGSLASLSLGVLSDIHIIGDRNIFDSLDFAASNLMLPIGGFLYAIFTGWVLNNAIVRTELSHNGQVAKYVPTFMFVIRFVVPLGMIIIFLRSVNVI